MSSTASSITTQNVPSVPLNYKGSIIAGLFVVIFGIGGFVTWTLIAPLASAVVANGVLKVDSSRKVIQHLEGGVVKSIHVKDGDEVEKGQLLLVLDRTKANASVAVLEGGYFAALGQQARLIAERDSLRKIVFPKELEDMSRNSNLQDVIRGQKQIFSARKESLDGQLSILDQQVDALTKDISGSKAQIKAKLKQIELTNDELDGLSDLFKKNMIDNSRLLALKKDIVRMEGEIGELESAIASSQTDIGEKKLQKFQILKTFREEVVAELKKVQDEVFDFQERINAARHVLNQTEIRSPADGTVVDMTAHTIGGVIGAGERVLEIVPKLDKLIVEARVQPDDIDRIDRGLPAGIVLTAFNQRSTLEVDGEVSYVSADILEDKRDGQPFYIARLNFNPDSLKEKLAGQELQPGMMAQVFVRTGERTMAEYLMQPLLDSFRRAWKEE